MAEVSHSQVLVIGAGPAGAALAHILASRGARVTLVERHSDFEREFRGEVVMPSGLRVLDALGLGDAVAELPSTRPEALEVYRGPERAFALRFDAAVASDGRSPLILSQPHLLELLVSEASRCGGFRFVRGGTVLDLHERGGRVTGARVRTRDGETQLEADLVVGADGRGSVVRSRLGFGFDEIGTPMDVVWCKLPWPEALDGTTVRVHLGGGHLLIAFRAPDGQLQVAWVILKGTYGELRARGVEEWVRRMAGHVSPDLGPHIAASADAISRPFLLDARTERVRGWARPGVLLIGDAAHTMSPVGGQGINVALRDAVVAANHLVPALRSGGDLAALDAAAGRVEPERAPEIDRIQLLAAQPPRLVMRRGRIAELARWLILSLGATPLARALPARGIRLFLDGVTQVELRV